MLTDDDHGHPTACARKWHLTFDDAIPAIELTSRTALLVSEFGDRLEAAGVRLIGHIKGLIDAVQSGHLRFSITSFEEGARFKGELIGEITEAVLTINVIVYGIEPKFVEKLLEEEFAGRLPGVRLRDDEGEGHAQ